MVCIGQNNYFRFNHPKQAAIIREQCKNSRFSIVPDATVYPGIYLFTSMNIFPLFDKNVHNLLRGSLTIFHYK